MKPNTLSQRMNSAAVRGWPSKGTENDENGLFGSYLISERSKNVFEAILRDMFNNLTSVSLKPIMSMLWFSKLPCFDVSGITGLKDGDSTFLKYCSWKGKAFGLTIDKA